MKLLGIALLILSGVIITCVANYVIRYVREGRYWLYLQDEFDDFDLDIEVEDLFDI